MVSNALESREALLVSDLILDGLPYPVILSDDAPARIAELLRGHRIALLFDARVEERQLAIRRALSAAQADVAGALPVRGGERAKSLRSLELVWRWLLECRADRETVLLAVGGGTVTDLAGFAAATFMRGIAWLPVPTTVLGMADAAIGGKTAIDLREGKNLAGAFWPPRAVIGDLGALGTLPRRERSTGLAEIVKAAVVGDPGLLELVDGMRSTGAKNPVWPEAIARAARVKIEIVGGDLRESGARAALNLGHTIGHGIEHAARGRVTHGHAVAIGLRGAGILALRMGMFSPDDHRRVLRALRRAALPLYDASIDTAAVLLAIQADKKRRDGEIRFVLPERIGRVRTGIAVKPADLRAVVEQCATPPQAEELGE